MTGMLAGDEPETGEILLMLDSTTWGRNVLEFRNFLFRSSILSLVFNVSDDASLKVDDIAIVNYLRPRYRE